jgi:hypothetical protein
MPGCICIPFRTKNHDRTFSHQKRWSVSEQYCDANKDQAKASRRKVCGRSIKEGDLKLPKGSTDELSSLSGRRLVDSVASTHWNCFANFEERVLFRIFGGELSEEEACDLAAGSVALAGGFSSTDAPVLDIIGFELLFKLFEAFVIVEFEVPLGKPVRDCEDLAA